MFRQSGGGEQCVSNVPHSSGGGGKSPPRPTSLPDSPEPRGKAREMESFQGLSRLMLLLSPLKASVARGVLLLF